MKFLCAIFSLWLLIAGTTSAETVVLSVKADNPLNEIQTSDVISYLPQEIRPKHILDSSGLETGYNVQKESYFVFKKVELQPNETKTFQIKLQDIWTIPEKHIQELKAHTAKLPKPSKGENNNLILQKLTALETRQQETEISKVGPDKHIAAYKNNLETLNNIKARICELENAAIIAGKDPGDLYGEPLLWTPISIDAEEEKPLKVSATEIKILNSSPDMERTIPVKHYLPRETIADDIIDAAGLETRTDLSLDRLYLYKESVTLAPKETATFKIKVKDRWNTCDVRIEMLKDETDKYLERINEWKRYPSLQKKLKSITDRLSSIEQEETPKELNEDYVSFFRDQHKRIDAQEKQLARIGMVKLPDGTTIGGPQPPPTRKTTWIIIYIILGFLAVTSLIVLSNCRIKSK